MPANRTVLVLGSDTRSFLSVVRSLGRYGLSVDAAWVNSGSKALHSRYLHRVHTLPTPWQEPDGWLHRFNDLLRDQQYDLVIPCNDPSAIPLQHGKAELVNADRICLLDESTFEVTQSKVLSTQLADSLGVPVPQHTVVQGIEPALKFAQTVGFPVVLKPTQSYRAGELLRKQTVVRVCSVSELELQLGKMLDSGDVQVQEHFVGIGTGVEFLADHGRIVYAFQHLRLHEPLKGGGSSYRTGIALHPGMLAATQRIAEKLHYHGVGMVEFRWNKQSDKWIFVEINGRFWGSLPLAIASGADFPKFLYQLRVEGVRTFNQRYRTGICCRNWEMDKNWLAELHAATPRRSAILRSLAAESAVGLYRTLRLRERSDTFAWDDPRPGRAELVSIGRSASQGLARRVRGRVDNLPLTKRLRRKRLGQLLRAAKRVLFVCKGNICRSPFAEAYARTIFPADTVIHSCGYYPVAARPCPTAACETAGQFGVDLRSHRSRVIDSQLVSDADVIFVFDQENRDVMLSQFGQCRNKVHYLGSFFHDNVYIRDPYGGDAKRFSETYQRIKAALDCQVATLGSGR